MKPLLHGEVHQFVLDIVNATAIEDTESEWKAYNGLKVLCLEHESKIEDHPSQWESLADFTHDYEKAVEIYNKALSLAAMLEDSEYLASINFALAERHSEHGEVKLAHHCAIRADEHAQSTNNIDLRIEISEFLLEITQRA